MTLSANTAELKAFPAIVETLVPGVDLKALETMVSKVKVLKPGTFSIGVDLGDKGQVELDLTLTP